MDSKKVLISIGILCLAQFLTWFQFFGQARWKVLHNLWLVIGIGIPVTILYFYATRIGMEGFGQAWPVRISQFVCGIIIFTAMSSFYLGEGLTNKNIVSLILCFFLIFIQIFWK